MADEEQSTARQTGRTVEWGTMTAKNAIQTLLGAGIVQGVKKTDNTNEAFIQDEDGDTCTAVFTNDTIDLDIEVICESGTAAPKAGHVVTTAADLSKYGIDTAKGVLLTRAGSTEDWSNTAATKLSLKITWYPKMTNTTVNG